MQFLNTGGRWKGSPIETGQNPLKTRMVLLYLLNCTDLTLTSILLASGKFYEANPLMDAVLKSLPATVGFKLLLPALLLCMADKLLRRANARQLKRCSRLFTVALVVYIGVNLLQVTYLFFL